MEKVSWTNYAGRINRLELLWKRQMEFNEELFKCLMKDSATPWAQQIQPLSAHLGAFREELRFLGDHGTEQRSKPPLKSFQDSSGAPSKSRP